MKLVYSVGANGGTAIWHPSSNAVFRAANESLYQTLYCPFFVTVSLISVFRYKSILLTSLAQLALIFTSLWLIVKIFPLPTQVFVIISYNSVSRLRFKAHWRVVRFFPTRRS